MNHFKVELIATRSGHYSAKVHYFDIRLQRELSVGLCSRFDPIKEAQDWVRHIYKEQADTFIIYGLGLGYHIKALLEVLQVHQKIKVIETNVEVYKILKQYIFSNIDAENKQLELLVTSDTKQIIKLFSNLSILNAEFCLHDPSFKIIPEDNLRLKEIFEAYRVEKLNDGKYKREIINNYKFNASIEAKNINSYYKTLINRPIIIVSGGPSLHKNVDMLKQASQTFFIFATGRALKLLIEKDIRVDMFCIIDADYEGTYVQIEGLEDKNIPFVFLNTASYKTVQAYNGPRFIAYGRDSEEGQIGKIETGGSVATAILSLAIKFGGNPIIFIGQDLGYTGGISHSVRGRKIEDLPNVKKVKSITGEYISTSSGLLMFKHWIESKIKKHPNVTFINCTEAGAYIEGCKHMPLKSVLQQFDEKS